MSERFYGRRSAIVIGSTRGSEGRRIEGLRMAWRVIMTATSQPFEATVEVYNPAPNTIAACREPDAQVIIEAGYQVPGVIFRGEPIPGGVRSSKQGPDTILALDLADSWRARSGGWLIKDYAAQTRASTVVRDAVAALGLAVGRIDVPGDLRWPRGVSYAGPAADVLDEVAESVGASWTLAEGAVYFGEEGQPVTSGRGPLITPTSGLIGSPTLRADLSPDAVEVRSLCLPTMRPGRPFRLESGQIGGDFVAREVQHVGDSGWDQPFYSELIGVPR